jgi:cytochrome c-type biogenesis protein CcmF
VAIVAVDSNLQRDLYLFVQGWDAQKRAEIQVFVNPLVQWLWIGGGVYALGGLLAFGVIGRGEPVRVEITAAPGTEPA